jgi:uncharacterized membrane protein
MAMTVTTTVTINNNGNTDQYTCLKQETRDENLKQQYVIEKFRLTGHIQ